MIQVPVAGPTPESDQLVRQWLLQNLLFDTDDLVGELVVDPQRRTITLRRVLADPLPGDVDFPELRRDLHNHPLSAQQVLPLLVDLPAGLLPAARQQAA